MKALIIGGGVAAEIHCKVLNALKVKIFGICDVRLAAAEALWDEMMAYIDGNPDYEMVDVEDYFTVNNYSVVVYLNGAKGLYGDGPTYFHYRADYKSDIWSFGEYEQCYQLSGCEDMAAYINSLLVKYLAE